MITLGIDISSQPKGTAACRIEWHEDRIEVSEPLLGCTDAVLDGAIQGCDKVGIDAPFGWPVPFVEVIGDWCLTEWSNELRDQMRLRATDRAVHLQTKIWPLSVSTDRIALPAMRTVALLTRHGVVDRSGTGTICEVYPAASLQCWGLPYRGYKGAGAEARKRRREILSGLQEKLPGLGDVSAYEETDHALDALIASLTARSAALGKTIHPLNGEVDLARREGWIHLPAGTVSSVCADA